MIKYGFTILILGVSLIVFPMSIVYAHSGHKKEAVEIETPAADSIYAVEEDAGDATGEAELFPLSRSDSLVEDLPTMEPMDHEGMERMDHGDHKMPEVEIAKREWVSPKQKGYGVAAGITVFAGLIFGVLHLKRPFE